MAEVPRTLRRFKLRRMEMRDVHWNETTKRSKAKTILNEFFSLSIAISHGTWGRLTAPPFLFVFLFFFPCMLVILLDTIYKCMGIFLQDRYKKFNVYLNRFFILLART